MAAVYPEDVMALLDGAVTWVVANAAVEAINLMARAYVRDEGYDDNGVPCDEIAAVIRTAACRLASNPAQLFTSETMGPFGYEVRNAFAGFNLAELAVLDRYRVHGL